jgi:hypothetical protein
MITYAYTIAEQLVEVASGGVRDGSENAGDARLRSWESESGGDEAGQSQRNGG